MPDLEHGLNFPLGAVVSRRGINLSLFSRSASRVEWPLVKL
jgi:hypothetical protein